MPDKKHEITHVAVEWADGSVREFNGVVIVNSPHQVVIRDSGDEGWEIQKSQTRLIRFSVVPPVS